MALDRNDLELLRDMMREVSLEVTKESETRMMAYIESHVEKKIDALADGLLATNERIDRLTERMDDMRPFSPILCISLRMPATKGRPKLSESARF